jgi:hypothetical protein
VGNEDQLPPRHLRHPKTPLLFSLALLVPQATVDTGIKDQARRRCHRAHTFVSMVEFCTRTLFNSPLQMVILLISYILRFNFHVHPCTTPATALTIPLSPHTLQLRAIVCKFLISFPRTSPSNQEFADAAYAHAPILLPTTLSTVDSHDLSLQALLLPSNKTRRT